MRACSVYTCGTSGNYHTLKGKGITFHQIPSNPVQRKKWVEAISLFNPPDMPASWDPPPRAQLCSLHFEERWLDRTGQTSRLRDHAVPTIFECMKSSQDEDGNASATPIRRSGRPIQPTPLGATLKIFQERVKETAVSVSKRKRKVVSRASVVSVEQPLTPHNIDTSSSDIVSNEQPDIITLAETSLPESLLDTEDVYLEPLPNCPFGARICSKHSLEEAESGLNSAVSSSMVDYALSQVASQKTIENLMAEIENLKEKLSTSEAREDRVKKKLKYTYTQIRRQRHRINKLCAAAADREFREKQERALSGKLGFAYGLILNEDESFSHNDDESLESMEIGEEDAADFMNDADSDSEGSSAEDKSPEDTVPDESSEDKSGEETVADSTSKDNLPSQKSDSDQTAVTSDLDTQRSVLPPIFTPDSGGTKIVHVPVVHPSGMRFIDSGKFKVAPVYLKKREILEGDLMSPMFAIKILTE